MKLHNEHIVCVALPSWEGEYTKSTVHLMTQLSRSNRVLYVDYPRTWIDVVRGLLGTKRVPLRRMFSSRARLWRPAVDADCDIHVLTAPPLLPINALPEGRLYELGLRINGWVLSRSIRRAMATLEMDAPVAINAFQPGLGRAMKGSIGERLSVYYCYDQIAEAAWCKRHGARDEKLFMKDVDTVVTTSDALWEEKERQTAHCYIVKNGVDFDLFRSVASRRSERELSDADAPVAGFVGCIDARVDVDMIERISNQLPSWRFEFVGPVVDQSAGERLAALANATLHGSAQPAELPTLMASFDVGLIPFKQSDFTRFIYPIKANEYLAAGLPVVMTPFANLTEFDGAVRVAASADEFVSALEDEIRRDSSHRQSTRQAFASMNSWGNRAAQFGSILVHQRPVRLAA